MEKEKYVACPYEKSHRILESRIQYHLVKCAAVHPDMPLVTCPYNASHKVPELELEVHCKYTCPNRCTLENDSAETGEKIKPLFDIQKVEIESSENWDNVNVGTYNPEDYCQIAPILQYKSILPPSDRKRFRAKERRRVQKLLEEVTHDKSSFETVLSPKTISKTVQGKLSNELVPASLTELQNLSRMPLISHAVIPKPHAGSSTDPKVSTSTNLCDDNEQFERVTSDDFVIPKYNARGRSGRRRYFKEQQQH